LFFSSFLLSLPNQFPLIMKTLRYFYHPDHLRSSSWITDGKGYAIQHLHYLPFGEDWVDQRNASWNAPYTFSGKEKDVETGYSYFGARYYDSGLSIWLSVDPMSDNTPFATPYAYCANNPVNLVDPDGRENKPALNWARANMSNKGIPFGQWFGGASGWSYKKGTIPTQTVCYESCFMAYMNSNDKIVSLLKETGFATKSGGFVGRSTPNGGMNWFKNGDGTDRSFVTDISKGELGDIVFMGNHQEMQGHAVLLNGLPEFGKDANGNVDKNTMILNTLSTGTDNGDFGERTFTFKKQDDGSWKQEGGAEYTFRGYGQINSEYDQ
jgi:RHS repeat-associated protein